MDYEEKINEFLKEHLSIKGFEFWTAVNNRLIKVWDRPSSSTGKYHKTSDGSIPTIGHHTYEMLVPAGKVMKAYNINKQTSDADVLLLAITLHDSMKYGKEGIREHTARDHDRIIADSLTKNIGVLNTFLTEQQSNDLIDCVRYHSGQWSASIDRNKPFSFNDRNPIAHFVHMLDMLSTANCLKI